MRGFAVVDSGYLQDCLLAYPPAFRVEVLGALTDISLGGAGAYQWEVVVVTPDSDMFGTDPCHTFVFMTSQGPFRCALGKGANCWAAIAVSPAE